ncbi:phospholipid/cholesterol/gamma-HCH transport system substrate-binding protein [Nocardioides aromaticivorans]|uniref:Phospholipid/cholesterol/gamma-HCH transport system substrate-binding protein n=1 Tax=Nocardioides aromaticivorans TaxID=200618 RepID=A0A7Y9ZIV4_9ACTN|nr:MlaD family protein [Nocardioides aromaticivorans]NYI45198.1 phospholipid/cholesterol/gamma-HCH transport system substrate-binding protein [Nocardioides aromaticivorans]
MSRADRISPEKRRERNDLIKFSAFLAMAAAFTLWVAAVTGEVRPGDREDYKAVFNDVSGLAVGDEVRIAGVDVGKVREIDVQPDNTVLVTFDVRKGQRLTTGTHATIQYRNLIGDRVIQLTRGEEDSGETLAVGGTLPAAQTASALDLDTLLNGFKPLFAGLSPTQVNELSGQLVQVLQGQQSSVATLVDSVASFTTTIGNREELIGQVVRNLNSVLGTVDDRRATVGLLLDRLDALLTGLDRQDTQVLDAAARISGFADRTATLVARARGDLRSDLQGLAVTARGLNKRRDTLDALVKKLPSHYETLQNTASYGNFFNFYLCGVRIQTGLSADQPVLTPWIYSDAPRCQR